MPEFMLDRFAEFADRTALVGEHGRTSYGELHKRIVELREQLSSSGIQAGDVVTLEADYTATGISALFALFTMGCIVAPISEIPAEEIKLRLRESKAQHSLKVTGEQLEITQISSEKADLPYIKTLIESASAGLILFSSGSTGHPKAMLHNATTLLDSFAKKRKRKHHILLFLLFDHIGGINTLLNAMASGASAIVPTSKSPEQVAKTIQEEQVHLLPASPTFLNLLLMSGAQHRYDLSSLRYITYGTEPMPESLLGRLKLAFPNTALIQTFGTSETGITQTTSRSSSSTELKIDATHTEYKIVAGELWLRSKTQILGYLNHNMDRFTADGWFKTGDQVEVLEGGYLKIKGRTEELINVGGEKVTPSEVESTLLLISGVVDCLVYGEANSITGQHVCAQVVSDLHGEPKAIKREIKRFCRKRLAAYKVPARIELVQEIPYSNRFKKKRLK